VGPEFAVELPLLCTPCDFPLVRRTSPSRTPAESKSYPARAVWWRCFDRVVRSRPTNTIDPYGDGGG
jgi:hypothetical protein